MLCATLNGRVVDVKVALEVKVAVSVVEIVAVPVVVVTLEAVVEELD
jgi:hypothetical protein